MTSLSPLAQEHIARLHRECVESRSDVFRVLHRAAAARTKLNAGVSRTASFRRCEIERIDESSLSLSCIAFSPVKGRHYYFTFELEQDEFFFVSRLRSYTRTFLEFEIPRALYRSERREAQRSLPEERGYYPHVSLLTEGRPTALLKDVSRDGLGIEVSREIAGKLPSSFELELAAQSGERHRLFAERRNERKDSQATRWLGLLVSSVPNGPSIQVEQVRESFERRARWKRVSLAGQIAGVGVDRALRTLALSERARDADVIRFRNQIGQEIVGLVNSTGLRKGAPVVLVPPAWGKTKETLLPLALTIVETCRRRGRSVSVVRFDGTNRRGESFVDADCRADGEEYRRFRFSQAVEDLRSAVDFVQESDAFQAPHCLIVSFSLSTIEARRVVANSRHGEIAGWIPVVGMVDLQSGLRAVSGGVDYAEGILKGVEFGRHELVGVLADMDFTGRDAIRAGLVFKEDARRDMAKIQMPITWIHGEHDSWIDVERVRDALRAGSATNRRLLQVPTGHQLRTSREALRTFELIASEVVRLFWGDTAVGTSPALRTIDRVREAERKRRDRVTPRDVNLRSFWRSYLLGRDGLIGMDLLTATSAYREMMQRQIAMLALRRSSRVLDLGSGTGAFLRELSRTNDVPGTVASLDLVIDALKRSRTGAPSSAVFIQADLDAAPAFPLADECLDAVLASLVVSYLRDPSAAILEMQRLLRPGGRVVLSSLCRDADISSVYADGVAELVASGADDEIPTTRGSFGEAQRSFLNEAARLLDLEEQGVFRFYDEDELRALVEDAGFRILSVERALGYPAQALIVAAERVG